MKLKAEFPLAGNDEFEIKEVEASDMDWICISSTALHHSKFFYFWSKPVSAEAMPMDRLLAELASRLQGIHNEERHHKLKEVVKFKTPGWEQWSFGTPNPLGDYLYGASKDSLKDSNG